MPIPLETVSSIPLLQGLDTETLTKVASMMMTQSYSPHDTVMRKGNATNNLGFLLRGALQVVDLSEDGRETGINVILPGTSFGELAVIDGQPRSASVVALKASEVAFLPNAQARALIFNRPLVAERMLLHFAKALRAATQQRMLLGIPNAFQRVFAQLQSLTQETPAGQVIELPKQHDVAIMVNTSRETVSRALHTLIKLNVIEKKGSVLIVHALRIFTRECRWAFQLPVNFQCRVVPKNAAFVFGMPVVGGFIEKFSIFGVHDKAVGKACWNPEHAFVFSRQRQSDMLPEGQRTFPDVDRNIEHATVHDAHQLALRMLDLVVQPAQHTFGRT